MSFKKELRFEISDASGPQRIEGLESNVREISVEFSHRRAHIEQMTGMMQKLLQAKSANRGLQEESSGGTGRERRKR